MKRFLLPFALAVLLAACASDTGVGLQPLDQPADIELQRPREVTVLIGESGGTDGKAVIIRFLELLEDTRCPIGAECDTAGRVGILVEVTHYGETKTAEVWLGETSATEMNYVEFPGLAVYLKAVEPYPRVDVVWERVTTSATFEVRFAGP